jgi:hypothetical protein
VIGIRRKHIRLRSVEACQIECTFRRGKPVGLSGPTRAPRTYLAGYLRRGPRTMQLELQLELDPACAIICEMAGHVLIQITERPGGGEPLRTAYAVAEPNQHRAIALFKLRPDHTADEQVEAVVELTQSALDYLGLKPGMIKPL